MSSISATMLGQLKEEVEREKEDGKVSNTECTEQQT